MVVRLSALDTKNNKVIFYDKLVTDLINKYNIGAICLFQGAPEKQATLINGFQKIAQTPLMVCIDAEWGLGQRFLDSVISLPKQMMLGAMSNPSLMYRYGKIVAEQCKRMGIHVNYAPVADVNNNPQNPVINDRSFGENKYKVADFAVSYAKGMQDNDIMACAKHFPGHGDVIADSHFDLPVINKSISQLDSLELFPFRALFRHGVESAMMAHLFIPAIESRTNMATSLSSNNVTKLLRDQMRFEGLTFTDALDMQAVQKFFPEGESSVESLIAGNDMLCLPADVPQSIQRISKAISSNRLTWTDIEHHCKKVLMAKYYYVINNVAPVDTVNLTTDLNKDVMAMRRTVAENAITLAAKKDSVFFPLKSKKTNSVAFIAIGLKTENVFTKRMRSDHNATIYYTDLAPSDSAALKLLADSIHTLHNTIIIGIHNINRRPAKNFDIGNNALRFISYLQAKPAIIFLFGNAYAAANWCNARNLVVCYEDDSAVHNVAADMLIGKLPYKGTLPVTVCNNLKYGFGITKFTSNKDSNYNAVYKIDSIVTDAITRKATPGAVVMISQNGKTLLHKAYGHYTYDSIKKVTTSSVYDVASLTKIFATTLAIMRLHDEKKIDINESAWKYLEFVKGSNKEHLRIRDILLHQAGISAFISFNRQTLGKNGTTLPGYYRSVPDSIFSVHVAENLYLRNEWPEQMLKMIAQSSLSAGNYVYSDNDFILLGKIIEAVTGTTVDDYVYKTFYSPMGLSSVGFLPLKRMEKDSIVPTENEKYFRSQVLQGTVHDPNAAMFGGVSGHAGLFSNAEDLTAIMQMLMNEGVYKNKKYLERNTIELFTSYGSEISRRGLGFDKPEKDNLAKEEPYPSAYSSSATFGHTGYTGTAAWADPENKLIFVFLSNRVHPSGSSLFNKLNVRSKVHDEAYRML